MERIQTAFRLDAVLLMRMKKRARAEKKSLNKIVEDLLYKEFPADLVWPKVKIPAKTDPRIEAFMLPKGFSAKELAEDDRLAYILSK